MGKNPLRHLLVCLLLDFSSLESQNRGKEKKIMSL